MKFILPLLGGGVLIPIVGAIVRHRTTKYLNRKETGQWPSSRP